MEQARTRFWPLLGAVAVVLGTVVVSAVLMQGGGGDVVPRTTYTPLEFDAIRLYPMDTLADVRAHSDGVVLATVVSEEEHESREAFYGEEGLIGRRITLRVDRTLWRRANAPAPPDTFETGGGSWSYTQGARTPLFVFGEVGKQYVFVVDKNTEDFNGDSYEWIYESTLAAPILSGRTPTVIRSDKPYFAEIRGKTPDELERLFAARLGG